MKRIKKPQAAPEINKALGLANRERIRRYLVEHPGATRQECAAALEMNHCVVGRHVKAIRMEWE